MDSTVGGQRATARAGVVIGTGGNSLPTVAVLPQSSFPVRIFITRIAPEVNAKRILDFVLKVSSKVKKVIKMKTRVPNPSFASFVVELESGEGSIADDPSKWCEGMQVRLHDDQIGETVYQEVTDSIVEMDTVIENPSGFQS